MGLTPYDWMEKEQGNRGLLLLFDQSISTLHFDASICLPFSLAFGNKMLDTHS